MNIDKIKEFIANQVHKSAGYSFDHCPAKECVEAREILQMISDFYGVLDKVEIIGRHSNPKNKNAQNMGDMARFILAKWDK